jgi:hypothetical protein
MRTISMATPVCAKPNRRRLLWVAGLTLYLLVYAVLSSRGAYLGHNQGAGTLREALYLTSWAAEAAHDSFGVAVLAADAH